MDRTITTLVTRRSLPVSVAGVKLCGAESTESLAEIVRSSRPSSSRATSAAVGRSAGSFASIRDSSRSSSLGTAGLTSRARGSSVTSTLASTAIASSPENARLPVAHSNSTQPSENTSESGVTSRGAARLLRRHVSDRPEDGAERGDVARRLGHPRDAEVDEPALRGLAAAEEDVRRLHVAVNDGLAVRETEGLGDAAAEHEHLVEPQRRPAQALPQILAVEPLHRQVRPLVVEQAVLHVTGRCPDAAASSGRALRGASGPFRHGVRVQHLERDRLPGGEIARPIDGAHSTLLRDPLDLEAIGQYVPGAHATGAVYLAPSCERISLLGAERDEHPFADQRDGRGAVREKGVVELLQGELVAELLLGKVAQLQDLDLAERVGEIARVERAATACCRAVALSWKQSVSKRFCA